jgi:thiol-disulfide isomerase/thioredoxin
MTLSLTLGPLSLPMAPVLLALAVWGASFLASHMARQGTDRTVSEAAGNAVLHAALLGLLFARLVYLAMNAEAYLASPWLLLDVRDGGWHAPSGLAAGLSWLTWKGRETPTLRRPLAAGALAGLVVWLGTSGLVNLGPARTLPPMAFSALTSGQTLSLEQAARGRPVVLNLWASWCGPCRQEMPGLAAAQQREKDVVFLFVNQGESSESVRTYLTQQNLPLQEVFLDPSSTLGSAVGSTGLPTTLFYDRQGRQIDAHFGVLNPAALESRLRSLRHAL